MFRTGRGNFDKIYSSVCNALRSELVCDIHMLPNGTFYIESIEEGNTICLTKEEMLDFANELIKFVQEAQALEIKKQNEQA